MPQGILKETTPEGILRVILKKNSGAEMIVDCDPMSEARVHRIKSVMGVDNVPAFQHFEEKIGPINDAEQIATVQMRTVLAEKGIANSSTKVVVNDDGTESTLVVPNNQINTAARYKALQKFANDGQTRLAVSDLILKLLPMMTTAKARHPGEELEWTYSPVIVCLVDKTGRPNGQQAASRSQLFLNLPKKYLDLFLASHNEVERAYYRYNREYVKPPQIQSA